MGCSSEYLQAPVIFPPSAETVERFATLPAAPERGATTYRLFEHFRRSLAHAYPCLSVLERDELAAHAIRRYDEARRITFKTAGETLQSIADLAMRQAVQRSHLPPPRPVLEALDDDADEATAEQIAAAPFRVNFWGRVVTLNRA